MTASILFQVAATVSTFAAMWMMGNKSILGPLIGIFSELMWAGVIVTSELWGVAPIAVAMAVIHVRNLIKWSKESHDSSMAVLPD